MNKNAKYSWLCFVATLLSMTLLISGLYLSEKLDTDTKMVKCYDIRHNEMVGIFCEEEYKIDKVARITTNLMIGVGMASIVIFTILARAFGFSSNKKDDVLTRESE